MNPTHRNLHAHLTSQEEPAVAGDRSSFGRGEPNSRAVNELLGEIAFRRTLAIERKRTERSTDPFLLMLVRNREGRASGVDVETLHKIAGALLASSRGTDVVGWYEEDAIVGVIYSGLDEESKQAIADTIRVRVQSILQGLLTEEQWLELSISSHFFPDDWDHTKKIAPIDRVLYPDILKLRTLRRVLLLLKRAIDVAGSAVALIVLAPLFWIIAVAIKVSSKGPIFFNQTRVGQHGKPFVLVKFRTMYTNIDHDVHKKYVTRFITESTKREPPVPEGAPVYKLTNDKRITRVGRFLRRTSLDEIPQFFNVLMGEMSLVGPRPAVRYEVAVYQTWHRRRVLEFKPGITGLWQVAGRSQVKFDDMVRLDLRYARMWSPWLDLKILLMTPLAVLRGTGAY